MYINSAHDNDSLLTIKNTKKPLVISSCGFYRLITRESLPTYRIRGRLDYQLIYIVSGLAHFYFDNETESIAIPAGSFVLYRPKEFQKYVYYSNEHTEVFWIHFSGNNVKNILRQYGITDEMKVIKTGTKIIYSEIFQNIIKELQQKKDCYDYMIESYFSQLLIQISRDSKPISSESSSYIYNIIDKAQLYFDEHYSEDINIDDYAASCGMSVSWFISGFKAHTNSTPLQYILSKRIANAQILLESTDYSINEISSIVGYDNQLYFSRLFTKQKGISPKKYRDLLK